VIYAALLSASDSITPTLIFFQASKIAKGSNLLKSVHVTEFDSSEKENTERFWNDGQDCFMADIKYVDGYG
jgi:hypothetical protein